MSARCLLLMTTWRSTERTSAFGWGLNFAPTLHTATVYCSRSQRARRSPSDRARSHPPPTLRSHPSGTTPPRATSDSLPEPPPCGRHHRSYGGEQPHCNLFVSRQNWSSDGPGARMRESWSTVVSQYQVGKEGVVVEPANQDVLSLGAPHDELLVAGILLKSIVFTASKRRTKAVLGLVHETVVVESREEHM